MKSSATSSAARPSRGGYASSPAHAAFDPSRFITARLPLRPVAGVPEIRLHQATPATGLARLARRDAAGFGAPYWAYPWAGGIALARHVLDHPDVVAGRRVLDLGTGSGLVAIAAAKAGARQVVGADVDRYAIAALRLNAAANHVDVAALPFDVTAGAPPVVDVVLVGDLFYARDLAARVTAFLERCRAAGIAVLIGDPKRAYLPHDLLREVAAYRVRDFGDGPAGATTTSAVYAFAPDGAGLDGTP